MTANAKDLPCQKNIPKWWKYTHSQWILSCQWDFHGNSILWTFRLSRDWCCVSSQDFTTSDLQLFVGHKLTVLCVDDIDIRIIFPSGLGPGKCSHYLVKTYWTSGFAKFVITHNKQNFMPAGFGCPVPIQFLRHNRYTFQLALCMVKSPNLV